MNPDSTTSRGVEIHLSAIDEERFGIRTARAIDVNAANLEEVIRFSETQEIRLLIARTRVTELKAAQAMEQAGFLLMDTLIYYVRDLGRLPIPDDRGIVRPVHAGEEQQVQAVAEGAFHDYFGHYHADDRLDPEQCDEAYRSWAVRSCVSKDLADEVLVVESQGQIVGFSTLRLNNAGEGEIRLMGVSPDAQRQGHARSLMIHSMKWCAQQDAQRLLISTQITNYAQQRIWVRLGFEPLYAYYTFHKWFD